MSENNNEIEINQENTKIIYVYLPRKYPPSKIKYIKKYQLEHPEKKNIRKIGLCRIRIKLIIMLDYII